MRPILTLLNIENGTDFGLCAFGEIVARASYHDGWGLFY